MRANHNKAIQNVFFGFSRGVCRHLRGGVAQSVPPAKVFFLVFHGFLWFPRGGVAATFAGDSPHPYPPRKCFVVFFLLFYGFSWGVRPPSRGVRGCSCFFCFFVVFCGFLVGGSPHLRGGFVHFAGGSRGVRGGFAPPFAPPSPCIHKAQKSFAPPKQTQQKPWKKPSPP